MAGKKDAIGDLNKPRLSLIPKKALWAMGTALTYGEGHYGTHNWRNGLKLSYLLDGALRHINEFSDGEDIDKKSQNHHLGNAMANLAMAIELHLTRSDLDDRYKANVKKTKKSRQVRNRTSKRVATRIKKRKSSAKA